MLSVSQWHHCCKIVAKPTPFLPISFLENLWTCHLTSLTYMDVDWVSSSHNCDILYYCCNIHEIYNITQFVSVLALRNAPNEAIEIKVFYFDFTSRLRLCTLYCDEILLKLIDALIEFKIRLWSKNKDYPDFWYIHVVLHVHSSCRPKLDKKNNQILCMIGMRLDQWPPLELPTFNSSSNPSNGGNAKIWWLRLTFIQNFEMRWWLIFVCRHLEFMQHIALKTGYL